MSDIKSYTSHNFSAVNEQIKQISKRERARTFSIWLLSLRTIFIYLAVTSLIIVLLMLSFSWAYRIINAPYVTKKTEVVRPEIIEKEVLKVVQVPVEKSIMETSSGGYKGPTNQPITPSSTPTSSGSASVVTKYNQFNTANVPEFSSYGFSAIITGYRYKDSESNYPEYQYCYFNKSTVGRATRIRADIAAINEEGIYESYIDSSLAIDIGITQNVLNDALGYCAWASAE
tara:strand:- start:47 stop:736 length:690 start_codon:yes stop_codon:yes gene_type:complete